LREESLQVRWAVGEDHRVALLAHLAIHRYVLSNTKTER
jgi:hypothetical protein